MSVLQMDKSIQVDLHNSKISVTFEDVNKEETSECRSSNNHLISTLTLFTRFNRNVASDPAQDLVRVVALSEKRTNEDGVISEKPKLALVRGSSLSLVELPTFICSEVSNEAVSSLSSVFQESLSKVRVKHSESQMSKKSQWTVMCVAFGFFCSCLFIVGGMLSVTSDYQDRAIARKLNLTMYKLA